jgi:nitrite reductase (NO-forming)
MRTFAMRLVGAALLGMIAVLATLLMQPFAADFIVVMAGFIGSFAIVGLATLWSGARTRPWVWLLAVVAGVLMLLFIGPYAPYALTHPAEPLSFGMSLVGLVAAVVAIVAGLAAWREVRRGRALWEPPVRAGLVMTTVVGLVIGACLTSVAAASSTSAGIALSGPPASTATVTALKTTFVEKTLQAKAGDVLGVFVTNKDPYAHSFDIDALGVHVALPASSTTFVAIRPTAAGQLQFYCGIPGHRDAGMAGTLDVH